MILSQYQIDLLIQAVKGAENLNCSKETKDLLLTRLRYEKIYNEEFNKQLNDKFIQFMHNSGKYGTADYQFIFNYPEDMVEATVENDYISARSGEQLLENLYEAFPHVSPVKICPDCGKPIQEGYHANSNENDLYCVDCYYHILDTKYNNDWKSEMFLPEEITVDMATSEIEQGYRSEDGKYYPVDFTYVDLTKFK